MKTSAGGIIMTLVTGVMLAASSGALACNGQSELFKLKIKVQGDNPVEVTHKNKDAEDLTVCVGDRIEWKLSGQAKKFFVDFGERAPFEPDPDGKNKKKSKNDKITVTVKGPASTDPYKYDIGLDGGGVWDPRIVVED
ncbi:MAG: hypothetical protein WBO47_12860 [Gammaproteobacteria bacterium]